MPDIKVLKRPYSKRMLAAYGRRAEQYGLRLVEHWEHTWEHYWALEALMSYWRWFHIWVPVALWEAVPDVVDWWGWRLIDPDYRAAVEALAAAVEADTGEHAYIMVEA